MSLAAGGGLGGMGGGAAGGGLAMAHQANAMAQPTMPNAPPPADIPLGSAPPVSIGALAAELIDKQQQLSYKQVRDLSHMPLVAIDLFSSEAMVATFPAKPADPSETQLASLVGKMKSRVPLKPTEVAHKTLRKWLSKTKGYEALQVDALAKLDDESAITIESPQKWLGMRRLVDAPNFLRAKVRQDESTTPAIAEEASQGLGVTMANSTLDGSVPQGDDFDRVVCKVRLCDTKKALTVLPEEALQLLVNQAQFHVARKVNADMGDEEIVSYPCCFAVPGVHCNDSSIEALLDATGGTGLVFQRSICALAGALLPGDRNKPNHLLAHRNRVNEAMVAEFTKAQVKDPDAQFEDDILLILAGVTEDTAECTAIQISALQGDSPQCLFGQFKVICNVSYQHEDPESIIEKCISEVHTNLDVIAPEIDGPIGMVTYGSTNDQKDIHAIWDRLKNMLDDWEKVPHFYSKTDAVAIGTAILGAVSHGRLRQIVQVPGKKPKPDLAIHVHNVSPVAVGVRMNYHGGNSSKWTPVKTIFDFDRRVPAGPYSVELNAAECAVFRDGAKDLSEEELIKAIKDNGGSKHNPKREEAALNLRVQVVQKWSRDGEWKNVGDAMSPLLEIDADGNNIACERVALELSLGSTGLISQAFIGER
jgi:hypothetical protein